MPLRGSTQTIANYAICFGHRGNRYGKSLPSNSGVGTTTTAILTALASPGDKLAAATQVHAGTWILGYPTTTLERDTVQTGTNPKENCEQSVGGQENAL